MDIQWSYCFKKTKSKVRLVSKKEKDMKKLYQEPTLTLEQFLTSDVMVASFDSNNSADFPLNWLDNNE